MRFSSSYLRVSLSTSCFVSRWIVLDGRVGGKDLLRSLSQELLLCEPMRWGGASKTHRGSTSGPSPAASEGPWRRLRPKAASGRPEPLAKSLTSRGSKTASGWSLHAPSRSASRILHCRELVPTHLNSGQRNLWCSYLRNEILLLDVHLNGIISIPYHMHIGAHLKPSFHVCSLNISTEEAHCDG